MKLAQSDINKVIDVISSGMGVVLTQEQAILFLNRPGRATLVGHILDMGAYDTEIRAEICSALSSELIGRGLPTFGDTRQNGEEWTRNFYKSLADAALAAGYSIEE